MNLLSSNAAQDNRQWASNLQPAVGTASPRPELSTAGEFASSPSTAHDLDPATYEQVLKRVRKPGKTVRAEDVLGDLEDGAEQLTHR